MSARGRLPDFQDRAPRDRYCDLILTGGVTSAIAYPAAIFALATTYRFNSIGGSSSGAGAAALAAAAEFRRRHGSADGFRILLERTEALAGDVQGRSGLAWLFQPAARNRRLFRALVAVVAPQGGGGSAGFLEPLRAYKGSIAAGAAVACAIVWLFSLLTPQGWLAYVASAAIGAVVGTACSLRRDLVRMVNGDFGLCDGLRRMPGAPHPTLIEWLHDLIQEIAGLGKEGPPLTFADLAGAPGSPRQTMGDLSPAGVESIRLQMFTANVTHGRPYLLPQTQGDPALYFRVAEMRRLFPDAVVDHMTNHSTRYVGEARIGRAPSLLQAGWFRSRAGAGTTDRAGAGTTANAEDDVLWRLPTDRLPVVVASRMSVSFPVLFSGVPLWVLDRRGAEPVFRRCLFSDGGLCSNFPIHLFDSPIPAWPTFGISLHKVATGEDTHERAGEEADGKEDEIEDETEDPVQYRAGDRTRADSIDDGLVRNAVRLPQDHREGDRDHWSDFADRARTRDRLIGFVDALLTTTKDWNDATLSRLPGVRERVAQVGLRPDFGGLNILMSGEQIRHLGELGGEAARRLLERFARPAGSGGVADGWSQHRWIRFNVLQDCLSRSLAGLSWSAAQAPYGKPLHEQIREAVDDSPLDPDESSQLLPAQAAALEGVLAALMQVERSLASQAVAQPYEPSPRPELRVRPPL